MRVNKLLTYHSKYHLLKMVNRDIINARKRMKFQILKTKS
jgi:hypothetical protein